MPDEECRPCEIAWSAIGIIAAIGLLYMAFDTLFNIPLPAFLTGARKLASVSPIGGSSGAADA